MPILVALAIASAPPPPPAPPQIVVPPIITSPPSPPSSAVYRRAMERLTQPPAILDLRISGAGGLVWQGSLRVGLSPATVRQERAEAEGVSCPRGAPVYGRAVRTSFALSLTSVPYGEEEDLFGLNVDWTRLPNAEACASDGSRTVQLQTTVKIPPHGSAILHGDADLTVEIHRR